jgi:hypothetical protein
VIVPNFGSLLLGEGVAFSEVRPSDTSSWDPKLRGITFRRTAGSADSAGYSLDWLEEMMDSIESDAAMLEAKEKGTTSIEDLIQELGL